MIGHMIVAVVITCRYFCSHIGHMTVAVVITCRYFCSHDRSHDCRIPCLSSDDINRSFLQLVLHCPVEEVQWLPRMLLRQAGRNEAMTLKLYTYMFVL